MKKIRKRLAKCLVSVLASAMIVTSLPVNLMTTEAAQEVSESGYEVTSGTFGDNGGFSWSYDEENAILTVTGEDSGINDLRSQFADEVFKSIKKVVFQNCIISGSMNELLSEMSNVETVEFIDVDTSNVTDMTYMFYNCINLTSVNVEVLNTSNVTSMFGMFEWCSSLSSVDVSGFNTANVTDMCGMFSHCNSLTSVDVSHFDTGNVENISYMFNDCSSLTSIDLSNFDLTNVAESDCMFNDCGSLAIVKTPNQMSEGQNIGLPGYFSDAEGNTMTEITSEYCNKELTKTGDFEEEDPEEDEGENDFPPGIFGHNGGFNWSYDEDNATLTITGADSGLNGLQGNLEDSVRENVRNIVFKDCVVEGSMFGLLSEMSNIETVEFINVDTTNVIDMTCMFAGCSSLTSVDISGFVTENVTSMGGMFDGCSSLTNVDVSDFDTSKVTDISYMFHECSSLASVDLSSFDTRCVTKIESMFASCDELKTIHTPKNMAEEQYIDLPDMFYDLQGNGMNVISTKDCNKVLEKEYVEEITEYTITYYLDAGTNAEGNPEIYTMLSETIVLQTPIKGGYTFGGWYTDNTYSNEITQIDTGSTGNIELYAQWIPNKYAIRFDKNGATSGVMNDLTGCEYGKTWKLTNNAYVKTGYTFAGWNTAADGSGKSYADAATVENLTALNGETVTLYAQWIPNKYTIKFDKNGATGGTMSDMTGCEYGKANKLTANAYVKTGYTFAGWNTAANGSGKSYANGATVENLASANGAVVTLYAQWVANKYTIKFDKNGATGGSMSDMTGCEYGKKSKLTSNAYVKTGYTFAGWNTAADGSGKSYVNGATVENLASANGATVTLYAQWIANKYSIKFDKNGATGGSMKDLTGCEYGKDYKLTKNAFKRKGYTFTGWNTQKNGKGTKYANQASIKNLVSENGKSITLYAQWKKESYKITYKLNGGKNNKSNPSTYTVTSAITLKKPTKEGYTFAGWYKDSKFKTKVTSIKKGSTGNITLYAKWTANKYTIKFDGNGATSGKMKNLTNRKYGTSYKLTANKFKKKGYTFVGWNTKKNGKGKSYKNKASVKNLISTNGKTVVLYAQWKKNK